MIIVHITEKMLKDANACKDGIAFWRTLATPSPKGTLRVRVKWTITHQLWASVVAPSFYGWARDNGLIPQISMVGANLRGANLRGANLRSANLYGANLHGANLRRTDLYGADLYGANLCVANLYGANLYGADLRGANLYGADLYGANLRSADLHGADLRSAYGNQEINGWILENGIYRKA